MPASMTQCRTHLAVSAFSSGMACSVVAAASVEGEYACSAIMSLTDSRNSCSGDSLGCAKPRTAARRIRTISRGIALELRGRVCIRVRARERVCVRERVYSCVCT